MHTFPSKPFLIVLLAAFSICQEFWKMKSSSNQPSSFFFVFLCFDHFYPLRVLSFFFFPPILLWPALSKSSPSELQYPGTIQRTEIFFCFRRISIQTPCGIQLESFLHVLYKNNKTTNKTTIIKRQPTQHFLSFFLKLGFTFCKTKQFTGKVKLLCQLQLFLLHGDQNST